MGKTKITPISLPLSSDDEEDQEVVPIPHKKNDSSYSHFHFCELCNTVVNNREKLNPEMKPTLNTPLLIQKALSRLKIYSLIIFISVTLSLPWTFIYGYLFQHILVFNSFWYTVYEYLINIIMPMFWYPVVSFWYGKIKPLNYFLWVGLFIHLAIITVGLLWLSRSLMILLLYIEVANLMFFNFIWVVFKKFKGFKERVRSLFYMVFPLLISIIASIFTDYFLLEKYISTSDNWSRMLIRFSVPLIFGVILVIARMSFRRIPYIVREIPITCIAINGIGSIYGRSFTFGITDLRIQVISAFLVAFSSVAIRAASFHRHNFRKGFLGNIVRKLFPPWMEQIIFRDFTHDSIVASVIALESYSEILAITLSFLGFLGVKISMPDQLIQSVEFLITSFILQLLIQILVCDFGNFYLCYKKHISLEYGTATFKKIHVIHATLVLSIFLAAYTITRVLRTAIGLGINDTL